MKQAKTSPATRRPRKGADTASSENSENVTNGKSPATDNTMEFDFGGNEAPYKPVVISAEELASPKPVVAEEKKPLPAVPAQPAPEPVKSSPLPVRDEVVAQKKSLPARTFHSAPSAPASIILAKSKPAPASISSSEKPVQHSAKNISVPSSDTKYSKTTTTPHTTHNLHSTTFPLSSTPTSTSSAVTGKIEPHSTRNNTMAINPPTVSDFRKNAERQAKEQQAVGSVLAWVGYSLLGAVIILALMAGFGGYTLVQMIHKQSVTVAQLDARYTDQINKQQADLTQLRSEVDKLTDQLTAVANLMAKQQEQLKRTAASVDDANNSLKIRIHDISDLNTRLRRIEGTRTTTVIRQP